MKDRGRRNTASKVGDAVKGGIMGLSAPRMFPGDVELGKKDDNYRPRQPSSWNIFRYIPFRATKKRIVALLLALCFTLAYWYHVPVPASQQALNTNGSGSVANQPLNNQPEPAKSPPKAVVPPALQEGAEGPPDPDGGHDDKLDFSPLAKSLHDISALSGSRYDILPSVLFAASTLKSIQKLIPIACDMGKWERNNVHFAITSRNDIPLTDLLGVNGVDTSCENVYWLDARPTGSESSSDAREEASVNSAINRIHRFVRAKVIITDDSLAEDMSFIRGARAQAKQLNLPIIELPRDSTDKFTWIARLDAISLSAWHVPSVDILIHAPRASSGSLLRLLKSLRDADYAGLRPPRLIVDLPAETDRATLLFIEKMKWPPLTSATESPLDNSQLIIRHRIFDERSSPEHASVQFLESFYPAQSTHSHVLVLSPQVQLSPLYYHYVRYFLLQQIHSQSTSESEPLFGFSLEVPSNHLNSTANFSPPTADENQSSVPFLWDAPNSNAALYLGPKWRELHSFLTFRMAARQQKAKDPSKLVSQQYPAWMEYTLEFMRARGYFLHYPSISGGWSLATAHDELPQVPEEFANDLSTKNQERLNAQTIEMDDSTDENPHAANRRNNELPTVPTTESLNEVLPSKRELDTLSTLPRLNYRGELIDGSRAQENSVDYAATFRQEIGKCNPDPQGRRRKVIPGSARDLFCFGDETSADYEDKDSGTDPGEQRKIDELLSTFDIPAIEQQVVDV